MSDNLMTSQETAIVHILATAYNMFAELGETHLSDMREFEHAIHAAQNIVMSRPVSRMYMSIPVQRQSQPSARTDAAA